MFQIFYRFSQQEVDSTEDEIRLPMKDVWSLFTKVDADLNGDEAVFYNGILR